MSNVTRVSAYRHLQECDLVPPGSSYVFFEPADTEIGVWVAADLFSEGCCVLDLGSGSGAAAAAMARAGAVRVHGVDSGAETVAWARAHYASPGVGPVTFAQGDFSLLSSRELLATAPAPLHRPLIVASNPPYVPLTEGAAALRRSISGAQDGLKWAPAIIGHAHALGSDLAFTIGSYSSPRKAARMLARAGYRIESVTLCPLPLGAFTLAHMEQVLDLEGEGEAVLWRAEGREPSYFVVGLACHRDGVDGRDAGRLSGSGARLTEDGLMAVLRAAARSRTSHLESLDEPGAPHVPVPLRVLDLPHAAVRHHW
ncbi:methyltransferase domain-containing protein [Streptomyces niger]|uniref:methyltransferase domain-containing protein n=1 Tax=Streptomyces niger TaxID=66373 RepID=UPI00069A9516|nr:methyltransferase domain-containing protein [Streptomyces niger]